MKPEGGQIRGVIDYGMKRRSDFIVEDEALRKAIADRVTRRLTPELLRVFRSHAINAAAFEGGDLRIPECGRQTYRPPTGGACVFSCGLPHEVTPVTRGRRFAFLPFLYDEAAARRREANNAKYVDRSAHYRYEGPLDAGTGGGGAAQG